MTEQPLIKFLTTSGAGSRRKMTAAIKEGRVAINGKVVDSFLQPVEAGTDKVTIDGKSISPEKEELVYLMLNKPKGVVSTTRDERGNKTVIDILPRKYQSMRLYPVGRLDKESTGLILLSNDGDFTYLLTHPKFEREKEYLVQLNRALTGEAKMRLENGLEIEEGKTAPAKVKTVSPSALKYSITIHEGKKRQVRRMFAALGYRISELKRIRMDILTIGELLPGEIRKLTSEEIKSLKKYGSPGKNITNYNRSKGRTQKRAPVSNRG